VFVIKVLCIVLKNVSKALKNVKMKMWFDGKNPPFNAGIIQNIILVKWYISMQTYKKKATNIQALPSQHIFPFNP
jgi:hypothetical protein